MKKFGYTLAEILIAITIIGVMTAVTLPLINNTKPDKTKVMYLKTYDSLVEILNNVTYNSQIFAVSTESGGKTYDISKCPLFDTVARTIDGNNGEILATQDGNDKLCSVVAESFGVEYNEECSFNGNFDGMGENSFINDYGIQFKFIVAAINVAQGIYYTEIYVDVDGDKGNNCIYDSVTCQRPDRFSFWVSPTGHLIPADEMGQAYLRTRTNLRSVDYVAYITGNNIEKLLNLPPFWDTSNANSNANVNIQPKQIN